MDFFYIINALGQNLADSESYQFLDCYKRPKSVISGNLSKMIVFEQLNDQLLVDSKPLIW